MRGGGDGRFATDRAIRAALPQVEQRKREETDDRARQAEESRQYRERVLAEAEAECGRVLGDRRRFAIEQRHDGWRGTDWTEICTYIEGVCVTYNPQSKRLSHDLTSLGEAILAKQEAGRIEQERKARVAAEKAAYTCPRCGEYLSKYRSGPPQEAIKSHRKWDRCKRSQVWEFLEVFGSVHPKDW